MSHYELVTRWSIPAPLDAVWTHLERPEDWPAWWKGVVAVALLEAGDADGIGLVRKLKC
jgi:hypothetical protein